MKATSIENCNISNIIGNQLGVSFSNQEFRLGKWGDVDNYCQLENTSYLLLECEKGQKHPNTNVLKIYPYLEENKAVKIILLHYFFPDNNAPQNRVALCEFLSRKMENVFAGRFQYLKVPSATEQIQAFLNQQKEGLIKKLLRGKVRVKIDNNQN